MICPGENLGTNQRFHGILSEETGMTSACCSGQALLCQVMLVIAVHRAAAVFVWSIRTMSSVPFNRQI